MIKQTTLQIPMSKQLKDDAEQFVQSLGYSSLQEWIRVQLTGVLNGSTTIKSTINISEEDYLDRRLQETVDNIAKGDGFSVSSAEELIQLAKKLK